MRAVTPFFHILLIITIALAPLVAGAGMMGSMDEDRRHAHEQIAHQSVDSDHVPALESTGNTTAEDECSGMDSAADCCASCIGCAVPFTFPVDLAPESLAVQGRNLHSFAPDLVTEVRPPRTHSS